MYQMKDIDGIVLFANAYTAVVLKGTHDEDGFYPEGLIDVHFPMPLVGDERLNPGDWISTKITVERDGNEKHPDAYFKDIWEIIKESIEPDDERYDRFEYWIKMGKKMEEDIEKSLQLPCFGELDYSNEAWRKKAKAENYPCQILSGCCVSEECLHAKPKGKQ